MPTSRLYFAYGSNMSMKRLRSRTPSAKFVAVAKLMAYRLTFHKMGRDGSGKCDIVKASSPHEHVMGVVYVLDVSEKRTLDLFEGLGTDYLEREVTVEALDGRRLNAYAYYATSCEPNCRPFHWYKQHVLAGVKENNFPPDYIEKIEAVPSVADPDEGRQARETAIYR